MPNAGRCWKERLRQRLMTLFSGGPEAESADLVFDAVGMGATRKAACEMVVPGGTIVHIGLQDSADGIDTPSHHPAGNSFLRHLLLHQIRFCGCVETADPWVGEKTTSGLRFARSTRGLRALSTFTKARRRQKLSFRWPDQKPTDRFMSVGLW